MSESKTNLIYSMRNVEDEQTITLSGDGEFCIGLTADETIACHKGDNNEIVVPLVMLTVWRTSGVTVCPASRDLKCRLNGEDVGTEAHIIPGNRIEVGDKVLELLEGSVPKSPRRQLPPTPGIPILPTPPPKPQRLPDRISESNEESLEPDKDKSGRDALREWCLVELPNSENELLKQIKDTDQLANLAASYLTRHINIYTALVMNPTLADKIFKMMQEVARHRRDILRRFLCEVISEVVVEDRVGKDETSHHATVTALLVEILRQFLDPGYLVLLCLQLLRAMSHIPGIVVTMVTSNITSAVLGSMSAYKDDETVQSHCLDILAKLAMYQPAVLEKPPMRESSIDLITRAMKLHKDNLLVIQAGIRTLANLAASLHSLASGGMIDQPYPDLRAYLDIVMSVLDYLYETTLLIVRGALAVYTSDLTVKTDGRRFMFEFAKMEQLRRQHQIWQSQPDIERREEKLGHRGEENDTGSKPILKQSRSFENLRTPERRVSFVNSGDIASLRTPSPSSSGTPSPVMNGHNTEHNEGHISPDIQVLSRNVITLGKLPSVDSSDGEYSHHLPNSDSQGEMTPPAKPARRPIGAPLVHMSSYSDSESEVHLTSPLTDLPGNHPHLSSIIDTENQNGQDQTSSGFASMSSSTLSSQRFSTGDPGTVTLIPSQPVDLTDFKYSIPDVAFMKRLMRVQVVCHVCSASIRGQDPPALRLIDLPLRQLLSRPGIPKAVLHFATGHFPEDTTLMDVDHAAVISVIDAVRYKTLAFDLIRRNLEAMVEGLSSKLHPEMFAVTGEVVQSVVRDTALSPIVADHEFISGLETAVEKVKDKLVDTQPADALIAEFKALMVTQRSTGQGDI